VYRCPNSLAVGMAASQSSKEVEQYTIAGARMPVERIQRLALAVLNGSDKPNDEISKKAISIFRGAPVEVTGASSDVITQDFNPIRTAVYAEKSGIVRALWFAGPAFTERTLQDISAFQVTTTSCHQGSVRDPKAESHSWIAVAILPQGKDGDTSKYDVSNLKKGPDKLPLYWESYRHRPTMTDFEESAGLRFDRSHEIWQNLEVGDQIAVVGCAESSWACRMKKLKMRMWRFVDPTVLAGLEIPGQGLKPAVSGTSKSKPEPDRRKEGGKGSGPAVPGQASNTVSS